MLNKWSLFILVVSLLAAYGMPQTTERAATTGTTRRELVKSFMIQVQGLIAKLMKELQQLNATNDGNISNSS
ncbi:uncharacterized protein [Drosophila virilis]|uniref:Uncharacterized protein n=1 Tax=Drosophila virilis TaxID=7244 RepID=A0A0Q9W7I9_DROVI|nr:uncharacterized protein Dvir_GJ26802 [Drosophila virilis]